MNFYVNAVMGSDTNDGLTPQTPWQSLVNINNKPFKPGDCIHFAAGTNYETLRITNLDATAEPIVYDAYGIGIAPHFSDIRLAASKRVVLNGLHCGGCTINNSAGVEVIDLECERAYGNGLEMKGSSGVVVTRGRFHDNGHRTQGGDKIGHGIFVGGGTGAGPVVVNQARCYSNMEDGIQFAGSAVDGSTVTGCVMYDNREDGVDVKGGAHRFTGNCMYANAQRAIGLHQNTRETTLEGNTFNCYRYALTVADGASVRSHLNSYVSLIRSAVLLSKTAASSAFSGDVFAVADLTRKAVDDQSTVPHVFDETTTLVAFNWMKTTDATVEDSNNG